MQFSKKKVEFLLDSGW